MDKPKIYFYQPGGTCVGRTTEYFDCVETQELMRQWSLTFSVTNLNPMRQYIQRGAVYEIHGQKFDHKRFTRNSGSKNVTSVTMAYHVCRRLDNYTVAAGYSYVGTAQAIIADILDKAVDTNGNKASTQFSVGTCADVSGSYSPGNTQPISAYTAIQGLVALGVEPQFDNFTINAPTRWGADRGMTFKFGRNLADLDFEDDADQNTTTYSLDAARRQYALDATPRDYAECGDTVRIKNDLIGEDIRTQRIVTLETHWDDHTSDKFTVGQFVSDLADSVTSMQVGIANSVQQAEAYNNVSITHEEGFVCASEDGLLKVTQNAQHCFAIWTRSSTSDEWTLLQELSADGLGATKIFMPNSPGFYAKVGYVEANKGCGLFIYDTGGAGADKPFCSIWYSANGDAVIQAKDGKLTFVSDADGNPPIIPEFPGYDGDAYINTGGTNTVPFHYKNGVLIGIG